MRILQVHNRQTSSGGADNVVEDERGLLSSAGHDVEQYFIETRDELESSRLAAALHAIWNGAAANEVVELARRFEADVVHVHTPFPILSPVVFRAISAAGIPQVATMHSYRYSCVKATLARHGADCQDCVGRRLKSPAVRHRCYHDSVGGSAAMAVSLSLHRAMGSFRMIDRLVTLTEYAQGLAIAEGFPTERVVVKPNFVTDPGPPLADRSGEFVFIGRLVEEKGVRLLLRAWSLLVDSVRLDIIGDGPLRPEVERAAAADPRITYHGSLDNAHTRRLLAESKVLLMTSTWAEGLPVVMLEALAAGVPIVAPQGRSFASVIDEGRTGLTFLSGSPASLADAVRRGMRLGDIERRTARAAFAERFSPDQALRSLEAIYRGVCIGN